MDYEHLRQKRGVYSKALELALKKLHHNDRRFWTEVVKFKNWLLAGNTPYDLSPEKLNKTECSYNTDKDENYTSSTTEDSFEESPRKPTFEEKFKQDVLFSPSIQTIYDDDRTKVEQVRFINKEGTIRAILDHEEKAFLIRRDVYRDIREESDFPSYVGNTTVGMEVFNIMRDALSKFYGVENIEDYTVKIPEYFVT